MAGAYRDLMRDEGGRARELGRPCEGASIAARSRDDDRDRADGRRWTPDERAWLDRLCDAPQAVPFLAAVELLARLFPAPHLEVSDADAASDRGQIRERHGDERLHFRHASGLRFDRGEIAEVEVRGEPPAEATLFASLFGLCGSSTPLPLYLAEEADEDDEHGAAIRGLLDVFHHRLFSLLIRGIRAVDLPATLRPRGDDIWSRRVLAYLGLDPASESSIPPTTMLRMAPILASGVRSPAMLAAALRILLEDQLGQASLRVEPLSGSWMAIDKPQWTLLGLGTACLGDTFVAGTEVLHPSGAAEIVIGPLSGEHYKVFTPGQIGYRRVLEVTGGFAPEPIHYDLVLEIEDLTYPPAILGMRCLGEDFWLEHGEHRGVSTRMVVEVESA